MARRPPDPSERPPTSAPSAARERSRPAGGPGRWRLWTTTASRRGRGLWAVVVGLSTVVGLVTGVLALLDNPRLRAAPPPRLAPMQGDLRVAVAPFGSTDNRQGHATTASAAAATRVATGIADLLEQELAPLRRGLRVELRRPAQLQPIGGASPAAQTESAARLARQHGADILVHGGLVIDAVSTRLEPRLYLAESVRSDTDELLGDHKLGAAVITPGDPESNQLFARDLAERLAPRVRALAALSVGITYFHLDRLAEADRYLTLAAQTTGWRDAEGVELLHLFTGNVAARRGAELRRAGREGPARASFARALEAYGAALAVQPGYARALYGIAETRFLQLDLRCQPATRGEVTQLRQVVAAYEDAARAPYRAASADLDLRIEFGIGRAYVCMSLAGADHRAQANARLRKVLAAADAPASAHTPAMTHLAAEAHAQLGLLALAEPDGPGRRPVLEAAAGHYQRAIALSQADPERARAYWTNLAVVYDQLDDPAAAARAREQARRAG